MSQVKITIRPNGPYRVEDPDGVVELVDANGNKYDLTGRPAYSLCRCGASVNKPFCDGTHSKIGFQAAEAAVVPSPDPIRLSVPKAYLLLKPGFEPTRETALDVFRFVRERLAPFKRVRRIEFTDLPKTISGKIRRVQLRSMEGERYEQHSRGATEFREEDFPELKG